MAACMFQLTPDDIVHMRIGGDKAKFYPQKTEHGKSKTQLFLIILNDSYDIS